MTASVRFITKRFTNKLQEVARSIDRDLEVEGRQAASEVADKWSNRIRSSGRGGRWNAQMSRIETSFTKPKSGALFIRMGWLGSPPQAEDGKTTWFVYQDRGYNAFGRGPYIPGLMAQMDARREMTRRMNELARDIVDNAERQIGSL